jgi:hypothetical protein
MERVTVTKGYLLSDEQRIEQILAVQEELLRSEGVDPTWPGFDSSTDDHEDSGRGRA